MRSKNIERSVFYPFALFFTLVFLAFVTAVSVSADDFDIRDDILMKYYGSGGSVTVPSNVKKIGGSAFAENEDITSVTLPEGCHTVEDGAFDSCTNMTTISLPTTLTSIGTLSFARCKSLEYIHLPPKLETIGECSFYDCDKLGSIHIPASLTDIGTGSFANSESLIMISVDGSNSKYTAVDNVLYTSDMKTLVQYPDGRRDETYTVPDGVETIWSDSFRGQRYLREINFPESLKEIKKRAFSGCVSLTSVELPKNMYKIYDQCFRNCVNLCRLYVRNSDQQTQATAFDGDSSLVIYAAEGSRIQTHADKYNIQFRLLKDDSYDAPDTEMKFQNSNSDKSE